MIFVANSASARTRRESLIVLDEWAWAAIYLLLPTVPALQCEINGELKRRDNNFTRWKTQIQNNDSNKRLFDFRTFGSLKVFERCGFRLCVSQTR